MTDTFPIESVVAGCVIVLNKLGCVERDYVLTSFGKDQIRTLKLEFSFLRTILLYEEIHYPRYGVEAEGLADLLKSIGVLIIETELSFDVAHHDGHQESFDPVLRGILENIKLVKAQTVKYYHHLLSSSEYCLHMNSQQAQRILPELMENLKSLLSSKAPLKEEIEGFEERLMFLRNILEFTNLGIDETEFSYLLSQIATVVDYAALACISFLCWTEKITESSRVKHTLYLSRLLQNMKNIRFGLRDIYIGFRSASKLLQSYDYGMNKQLKADFVSFLVQNLMELLDSRAGLQIPIMNHIGALHEDLRSLTTSQTGPLHSILMHIEALNSAIGSFGDEEIQRDLGRKMRSLSISGLEEDVKLMYIQGILDLKIHEPENKSWVNHCFNYPLQCLKWQEEHMNISDQFHCIIDKLKFNFGFVLMRQKQLTEKPGWYKNTSWYLLLGVQLDVHAICIAIKYGMVDGAYFHLSRLGYDHILNSEGILGLLGSLLQNLEALQYISKSFSEQVEILVEKLRFLKDVVNFASEEKIEQDNMCSFLNNQIKTMCIEAISFSYQWFIHKDEGRMYSDMSYLTPKINAIEKVIKELSFKKANIAVSSNSETLVMIELVMVAIYLVQDDFGKLLNNKSSWMIPLESRIKTLHRSLSLLWGFPKRLPEQFTDHEKFNDLFTSIAAFVVKIESLVHCSHPKTLSQVMIKEIDSMLLDLIIALKLISAQFTLMEMEILNSKAILSAYQMQEQVETLHTGLKFLIAYLIDLPRQYINHEKHNHQSTLIEVVASEAEDVICIHFTNAKEGIGQLHLGLSLLLAKIKLIHAKVSLVDVLNCKAGLTVLVMDGVETLKQEFEFLEILLVNFPKEYYKDEKLNNLVALVDKVATEAGSIISSIHVKEMNVEMAREMNQCILGLFEKIVAIKMADRENFPKVSHSRFPKSNIPGFMEFLIGKIKDLLEYKPDLISPLWKEIQSLQVELEFLITSLRDISTKHNRFEELTNFWAHVADVAYKVEHAIDSFISSKDGTFWKDMLCICITEINLLKMEVTSVNGREENGSPLLQTFEEPSTMPMSARATTLEMNEVVVGFKDEEEKIKKILIGGHSQLDVISIVGMPGLGKTTLAKKIYNYYSSAESRHFDVCSFCCVSQAYEKKELLLDMLCKSFGNLEELHKKSEGDLSEILQRSLKGNRYLILMDDIWSTDAWDNLKTLFPNENNRSRIILTTRLEEVASYATEYSEPHHLRLFRPDESWSLLLRKLFQNGRCPSELEDVGKTIAEKCRGLPLSVVLIAGLLNKTNKDRHWWENVAESVSSHFDTSLGIVELSYKHLPPYLKPCFLYFGGFQEDEEVPVSQLIWLWLAEGFIHVQDQAIRRQESAQNYLLDLVGRSLVMKTKIAYDGKIKSCRVHDLIHEFCQKKAREENFLLRINGDYHADSPHCYSKKPAQRRLSIFSTREAFAEWNPSNSPVRSLTVKVTSNNKNRSKNHDISSILQSFNLLRVLDLRCIFMANFPEELQQLIHLSYLAVRTGSTSIPSSIANLWNLQTFLFKGQRGEVHLPESIWNMVHLKNVQINDRASLGQHKYRPEFFKNSVQLANLENFSTPSLSYGDDMEKIIMRLSNLRKLKCRFSESRTSSSWGYSKKLRKNCNRFPVLNDLGELESLKVLYNGSQVLHPCEFNFPSNLKKLTLSSFRLHWSDISQLGALQNLEMLKLVSKAFEGEEWTVGDKEFPKLKLLKLDNLNLVRWKVSDGSFPCLEQLVLIKCKEIKEMPIESLDDNTCLRSIEVKWCSCYAAISTKDIQENRIEFGDYGFRVLILPPDWDSTT